MILSNKKVAIIGAGPGGLVLGRLLQLNGVQVQIYERDAGPYVRQQGSTLDLHEDAGLLALDAAGLMDAFKKNYRRGAGKMRIADKGGKIYVDDHAAGAAFEEIRPEIDRGPLRKLLIDALLPGSIKWGHKFVSMEKCGPEGGWELHFEDDLVENADLVIAADGARSRVRPYLTPIQPIYSGVISIEGHIQNGEINAPELWAMTRGGKAFILDDCKTFILSTKGDGTLSFLAGFNQSEDWFETNSIDFTDPKIYRPWFKAFLAGWHPMFLEVLTNDLILTPRKMLHYPSRQSWATLADLTIIGDAAHLMPPYAGEGVNMAMLDALMLANALTAPAHMDTKAAIAFYESAMLKRAAEVTTMTLDNTSRLHSPNAIRHMQQITKGA